MVCLYIIIIMLMDSKKKQNCALFTVVTILTVIANLIATVYTVISYLESPEIDWFGLFLYLAILLWQWTNTGIFAFYFFSGNKVPKLVRIYLYILIGIFGLLMLMASYIAIALMIEFKQQQSIILALAVALGMALGYAGINIFMAYTLIHTKSHVPMFMMVATNVKKEEVIAS